MAGPIPIPTEGKAAPGECLRLSYRGVSVEWYFPTEDDLRTLMSLFPGADPEDPPWELIQAKLVTLSPMPNWSDLSAPAVVALLRLQLSSTAPSGDAAIVGASQPNVGSLTDALHSSSNTGDPPRRPCYERDHLWLVWKEREKLTPARIRNRWNAMTQEQRMQIAPNCANMIAAGGSGADLVKKALNTAGREKNR